MQKNVDFFSKTVSAQLGQSFFGFLHDRNKLEEVLITTSPISAFFQPSFILSSSKHSRLGSLAPPHRHLSVFKSLLIFKAQVMQWNLVEFFMRVLGPPKGKTTFNVRKKKKKAEIPPACRGSRCENFISLSADPPFGSGATLMLFVRPSVRLSRAAAG